ncbi:hypothetical protein NO1_1866 [Candidatus Termititenax aidoneus]|uniref:DNA-directed RNA polymerase subunit alpha n=1 Tax=Termititenax aidoneus TaxID=2218524 RepID=A0A388TDG7_TERA1|nr:hypothetical protein NO1_1866 [Candidatus Termititenax aidoneus]
MAIKARVKYEEIAPNHGVFTAEPLERGYGATLGNALRRILLSSLDGAAVSGVQISALDNIEEDELEVLANLKNLALKSYAEEVLELTLEAKGEGVITARDIQHTSDIEISNPDLHIATIKRGGKLKVALTVEKGVGYQIADEENKEGKVRLNASYSPVVKVDHRVEPARVGKSLDYDRLILEVWTNNAASPEEAVKRSSQLFKDQMDALLQKNTGNLRAVYTAGADKYSGVLTVEPLEKGYGTTLGNSLRRILLSSIEGAVVTAVKIEGVDHEFSTIDGVKEDVLDIIMNIKKLAIRSYSDTPLEMTLTATEKDGEVTAKAIQHDDELEIINTAQHIATLGKGGKLQITLTVEKGVGYQVADVIENKKINEDKNIPLGTMPIDAAFSPIVKVNHRVEQFSEKKREYDKLFLEIWTNGVVTPEDAVKTSAQILQEQIDIFLNPNSPDAEDGGAEASGSGGASILQDSVDVLELSSRSSNCLRKANIRTVGELVNTPPERLQDIKSFGKKSAEEINAALARYDLKLKGDADDFAENTDAEDNLEEDE